MAEYDGFKLFGFEIKRAGKTGVEDPKAPSIVPARDEDGAGYVTVSGSHYGQYISQDGTDAKDNHALIMKYRGVAMHPEVDMAIEDIVNESVVGGQEPVSLQGTLLGDERARRDSHRRRCCDVTRRSYRVVQRHHDWRWRDDR